MRSNYWHDQPNLERKLISKKKLSRRKKETKLDWLLFVMLSDLLSADDNLYSKTVNMRLNKLQKIIMLRSHSGKILEIH